MLPKRHVGILNVLKVTYIELFFQSNKQYKVNLKSTGERIIKWFLGD